jgi:hypothetical protein
VIVPACVQERDTAAWKVGTGLPVAHPNLGDQGLSPNTHRVLLAGPVEGLQHPPLCPNCGAASDNPLPITKVFMYNYGGDDDGGWRYRMARATPLFCDACIHRHQCEAVPVTNADRLKSVILTELAIPGFGLAAFGLFVLNNTAAGVLRDFARQWPILILVGALFLMALLYLRASWTNNAHRRVPMQTNTSQAFDFGDDGDTSFRTTLRTYALRNADHAEAFKRLNAERSSVLLGPTQRRRENRRFWITAAVIMLLALVMYYVRVH